MTHPPQPSRAEPPQRERRGPDGKGANPERLYTITGGSEGAERAPLDLVTLIIARADPPPAAPPEQAALLRLCKSPLSTAEISAYLSLPFSVVTVLLGELLAAELVQARAPVIRGAVADRSLLEAVMHGLQKL
ncbi:MULTISPECIES: DUF742 domain-containing protein [Streptomyces]|jgi:hypothetical protein|uniref:DUF742 domain-containing protein n=2 Tax=Streptomyces TaxID=1883 RepID=A0AAU1UE05_9ACTN|nr:MULTISPECIES: DUF742 domain-containing protein [unclassified Streptomyces]MCX4646575.1 DUF742 domain-containing protein [Streptomyces sp. NBC_01446]MCX5319202.1 DUF742 domain-containing protein [Streptomyces sp. NBC_00120]WSD99293.1 DUF742 domain-containing protein [Streptomyces sp. NBC_01474]